MTTTYHYTKNSWDSILPDGSAFCHWGGKDISYRILRELDLGENDRLGDVCCGEAGTLSLLKSREIERYGVDISHSALQRAYGREQNSLPLHLIQSDAQHMPFADEFFTKLISQDADVFLCPEKQSIMEEISRVASPGALYIMQTYAATTNTPGDIIDRTSLLLRSLGYSHTNLLIVEELPALIEKFGFSVEQFSSAHGIYTDDNLRMLEKLHKKWDCLHKQNEKESELLLQLLEWERFLFREGYWTGIILYARKK